MPEFFKNVGECPKARIRFNFITQEGNPIYFVVQLEYEIDEDYKQVVRFDHSSIPQIPGHDITEEGLHMDIYQNEEKKDVKRDFPQIDLNKAISYCESYIQRHIEKILGRFKKCHDIKKTK